MCENIFIVAKNVLRKTIRRSKLGSLIRLAICPLVNDFTFFPWPSFSSSSRLTHWNFRRSRGHSVNRQRDLAITKLSFLCSFSSLYSSLEVSVHSLFLYPYTWKSRVFHQILAQNKHLRTLNHCSSCDKLLPKIFKLIILASNASSSSTKVLKCPYTKNDSIFTHYS
ncbi:hypothetical protein H5410_015662 [Solanum commersonii]|uniref:Uncharacterized protein n=1 Tax=Solanum commersonii TaxID=4109 RepID=A0A9J5ZUA9_SOLCO|nr:hypothetical protein H5410_015662 [Solanum commersonii]